MSRNVSHLSKLVMTRFCNPICRSHRLHGRNLAEMAALHKQLKRIVAQKLPEAPLHAQLQQKPPTAVSYALRRAMAAGWADQVSLNRA